MHIQQYTTHSVSHAHTPKTKFSALDNHQTNPKLEYTVTGHPTGHCNLDEVDVQVLWVTMEKMSVYPTKPARMSSSSALASVTHT